jgi:phosphoglucomutase
VEVIDSVADYVSLMKDIFDFKSLRDLLKGTEGQDPFRVLINSLNGGKLHNQSFGRFKKQQTRESLHRQTTNSMALSLQAKYTD